MKRAPILLSFLLFVALCASGTYWTMQWLKPVARPVVAPKQSARADVNPEAADNLFGGRAAAVVPASNFQLKGVVVAKNAAESIAILSADGKPAEATRVNSETIPGVTVKEVHPQYVLISEGGITKRVELPAVAPEFNLAPPVVVGMPPPQPVTSPMGGSAPPPSSPPPPSDGNRHP
jgi:general secretion pathway protein C